jgi:hypothetical protein
MDLGGATADGDAIVAEPWAVFSLGAGCRGVWGDVKVFVRMGLMPLGVPLTRPRALPTALMCFFPTL